MGNIRLYGSTSGYTELAPPAVAPDGVLSLPTGTGTLATQASVGLVKIVDQSFTAVSSVSVNNCFSSAYENYRIVLDLSDAGASQWVRSRLRAAGTDNSASNYYASYVGQTSANATDNGAENGTSNIIAYVNTGRRSHSVSDIHSPQLAVRTHGSGLCIRSSADTASVFFSFGTYLNAATAYDGITIFGQTSTITGTIRIYGYQN